MAKANSKAAPTCRDSAGLATHYFNQLVKDPSLVALEGYLDDAKRNDDGNRDEGLDAFGIKLQEHLVELVTGGSQATLPSNPLIGDSALETVIRCHHVATYIMFTAPNLTDSGSSDAATDGFALIMETLVDALNVVVSEIGGAK